jgi:AraC-like DNA-binding protein
MARPPKEINWEVVERLMECGCKASEIAGKFRINDDTFYRRFKEEYGGSFQDYKGKASEAGLAEIKAMIHAKALNNSAPGNSNLLIFLARCKLGMREPLVANDTAPNQSQIDQSHIIMKLENRIAELEEQIGEDKPQAE